MLPKKLGKEPILDAIFELRFTSDVSVSDILPGILYMKDGGEWKFERTQIADMPKQFRDSDSSLKYAILTYMNYGNYTIGVGDKVLNVSSRLPYKGWGDFKKTIVWSLGVLAESGIVKHIERFSLKYIDLLESSDTGHQVKCLNVDMTVAGKKLDNQNFNLQIGLEGNNARHLVTLVTDASVNVRNAGVKRGVIVDVDSQIDAATINAEKWHDDLLSKLDMLHLENKEMFFNCLTDYALDILEPSYE
ncbi:TIGR04255 family protein [Halomonas sp. AOP12-C2-37]|uniref:TIGR04255 family protein n=1 Tax=unclassified Halomonas TaxID=2609666 RepID=UPI0040343688